MKIKLFEDDNIIIYTKREMEIGEEPTIADTLLTEAMVGYKTFASHLEKPQGYIDQVELSFSTLLKELRSKFKDK